MPGRPLSLNAVGCRERESAAGTRFSRGFTLIELLLVLFVAGLIAAFVLPSFFGGLRGMNLKAEVKHLAATLRFARSQAVCCKGMAVVEFDLDNNTYELTIKRGQRQSQQGLGNDIGLLGGGQASSSLGSLGQSSTLGGSSSLGRSSGLSSRLSNHSSLDNDADSDALSGEGVSQSGKSESPLLAAAKKKRKLKKGVSIAAFTYGEETFEDGTCNVFFFPRGSSTGGLIEIMSESGRSFVIEVEPVTGSVKIKSPDE